MTTRPDPDPRIAAWLEAEAPDRAPERLLSASRDRIQIDTSAPCLVAGVEGSKT